MNHADFVKLVEIVSSKICHDLISPVGAVSNGVEILEEMGADAGEDVVSLISFSAEQANAKLKTLRMAYGLGGSDSSIKPENVHQVFGGFIAGDKRVTQDWDPHADLGLPNQTGFAKILLCCLLLGVEGLPKGGNISVGSDDAPETVLITIAGDNAHFRDGYLDALEQKLSINELDPKHVHAYMTGLLATRYGYNIHVNESRQDFIFLRLTLSDVS